MPKVSLTKKHLFKNPKNSWFAAVDFFGHKKTNPIYTSDTSLSTWYTKSLKVLSPSGVNEDKLIEENPETIKKVYEVGVYLLAKEHRGAQGKHTDTPTGMHLAMNVLGYNQNERLNQMIDDVKTQHPDWFKNLPT